jgi:hypothetical protein
MVNSAARVQPLRTDSATITNVLNGQNGEPGQNVQKVVEEEQG